MHQALTKLLKLARDAINSVFTDKKIDYSSYDEFSEKRGVFVSLSIDGLLRGCIGYVEPAYSLREAVVKVAQNAAFRDERFPIVTKEELAKIKIEISILSEIVLIEKDYLKNIKIGIDGLVIESLSGTGLLLPQVAKEHSWNAQEFLEQTCLKAGLKRDSWKDENVKLFKFQVELISET